MSHHDPMDPNFLALRADIHRRSGEALRKIVEATGETETLDYVPDPKSIDEPFFMLKAHDLFSLQVIHHYLWLIEPWGNCRMRKILLDKQEEFRAWQVSHPTQVGFPDVR